MCPLSRSLIRRKREIIHQFFVCGGGGCFIFFRLLALSSTKGRYIVELLSKLSQVYNLKKIIGLLSLDLKKSVVLEKSGIKGLPRCFGINRRDSNWQGHDRAKRGPWSLRKMGYTNTALYHKKKKTFHGWIRCSQWHGCYLL